ncbi:MAG TPA: HD domain-containing phosphohydrolase, partial [Fimbriimonadaceae bacterium]|nr:HD domain-containing phosphohydrolase [Fimbriimonadaceae bacterium]
NPESALRALELGATDFLTKPGNPAEITLRVRNALHAQQMHKALVELRNSLEEKVSERTHALWQSQIEILERLTRLANWRHEGSASHSRLVAHLSWRIARELGLSPTEAELIRLAAPLLDIGEVGIPDAILAKRGLLTDNELNIVCSHCQIGAEVLSGGKTRLITLAEEIAHTHHEKWNGSGYPRGLWREQIPIAGRIVALADSYYSLRTERAHRRAFSHEEALEDIQRESGKRFDPSVIEAFLRIEEEIVWPDGQAA